MSEITKETNAQTQAHGRYLSFSLGKEEYAVPLLQVKEVIAPTEFTPIPFAPPYFVGIMNLRGQVISVIDLRKKFNVKSTEASETAIIICDLSPLCLGIVVDSVNLVLSPEPSDVSPKPEVEVSAKNDFITGVYRKESKLILFLDIAKSLSVEDHVALKKNAAAKAA